jgi:hypothetical protein
VSEKVESVKDTVSDTVRFENLKSIGRKASESAESAVDTVSEKMKSAKNEIVERASLENMQKIGEAVSDMASVENVKKVGKSMADAATLENTKEAIEYASGVKGYQDIKKAKEIKRKAEGKIRVATGKTEKRKKELNLRLEDFAAIKLAAINKTICVFVECLKRINQKYKGKEYEALKSIDVKKEDIAEIKDLGISTVNLSKGAAGSSMIGATALFGVKAAVLSQTENKAAETERRINKSYSIKQQAQP